MPVIDHGLDEEKIWAFRKTNYNQDVIYNPYTRDIWNAQYEHNAPWWGLKLSTPAFYKDEKYSKFFKQYAIRLDFQRLKLKHAQEIIPGDMAQRDRMKAEVGAFLANAKKQMLEDEMSKVYVTDHKPAVKKFSTLSEEEDQEYFNYVQSLEAYNKEDAGPKNVSRFESGRYERGTLLQRIFEPLAGAKTLESGTVFLEISDKDVASQLDEGQLRATFEKMKDLTVLEGEDEAEVRAAVFDALQDSGFDQGEWDKILARELNTFKEGEKYDYVTDLRRTFDEGLSTTTVDKIFKKMPAHVFWDIKKP